MDPHITYLETDFTPGLMPAVPVASDIALEASTSEALATAFLGAAWEQAESFTGRAYRGIAQGVVMIETAGPITYHWPRYPYPEAVAFEHWDEPAQAFRPMPSRYKTGRCELVGGTLYRLTQTPTEAGTIPAHVRQAVANLALYQLIHLPQRREFRTQTTGDVTLTREAVMGLFYGSGAGALLASEVRK